MSNNLKVKNNVCVEVFNKDGSLDQKTEGHNFISININKWAKYALRTMLGNHKNYSRLYSSQNIGDFIDNAFIHWMYCTDSTAAESPTTEVTVPGTTIADADLNKAFAQTTGTKGTVSPCCIMTHEGDFLTEC